MQRFKDLASNLLAGREIEFSYKGKQYSITNGNGRWILCCDTDKLLFLAMAFNLKKLWMKQENGRLKTHLSEIHIA